MDPPTPTIVVIPATSSEVELTERFSQTVHDFEHDLKVKFVDVETLIEDIDDIPTENLEVLEHAFDKASQRMENLQKFASEACLKLAAGRRALELRARDHEHVQLRERPGRACDSGVSLASNFGSQTLSKTNSSPVMSPTDSVDDYQSTTISHQKKSLSRRRSDSMVGSDSGVRPDSMVESENGVRPEIGAMLDTGPVAFIV